MLFQKYQDNPLKYRSKIRLGQCKTEWHLVNAFLDQLDLKIKFSAESNRLHVPMVLPFGRKLLLGFLEWDLPFKLEIISRL